MPSGLQHLKHSTLRTPRKKGIKSEDTSVNLKTPTLNTRNSVVSIELRSNSDFPCLPHNTRWDKLHKCHSTYELNKDKQI